jgi:hypothetical protein
MTGFRSAAPLVPLDRHEELFVVQKKELAELFGFETRNKYAIEAGGTPLAYAAEQGKDFFGFVARWLLGHWRRFEIHVFDANRALWFRAVHPFRFFFQRLEVVMADGRVVGAIQQRWAVFSKRFDVTDANGHVILTVKSPLWKPWTFAFAKPEGLSEIALVQKKWSGTLTEVFTDADRFRVAFRPELGSDERVLVLAAALFIDLVYFEQKAH